MYTFLIGDDVEAVIRDFEGKVPLFNINAPGFSGSSYEGYELFFEAVIDQNPGIPNQRERIS